MSAISGSFNEKAFLFGSIERQDFKNSCGLSQCTEVAYQVLASPATSLVSGSGVDAISSANSADPKEPKQFDENQFEELKRVLEKCLPKKTSSLPGQVTPSPRQGTPEEAEELLELMKKKYNFSANEDSKDDQLTSISTQSPRFTPIPDGEIVWPNESNGDIDSFLERTSSSYHDDSDIDSTSEGIAFSNHYADIDSVEDFLSAIQDGNYIYARQSLETHKFCPFTIYRAVMTILESIRGE